LRFTISGNDRARGPAIGSRKALVEKDKPLTQIDERHGATGATPRAIA
jgi:hypothetical protein